MQAPFEYAGRAATCMGCADIVHTGDMVAPIADDRPDRLVCVACWWLLACDVPLPRWTRPEGARRNLSGVFQRARDHRGRPQSG